MSYSSSYTETKTFTLTHAKHLSAKVATDLKRIQRLYGSPSDTQIANFESELVELLKAGYLDSITYGYQRDGKWIEPTLRYTSKDLSSMSANDDDPGRIKPGANIDGASFRSYLMSNSSWHVLSAEAQSAFSSNLAIQRVGAEQPGLNGYLSSDKSYSAGGKALDRSTLKTF